MRYPIPTPGALPAAWAITSSARSHPLGANIPGKAYSYPLISWDIVGFQEAHQAPGCGNFHHKCRQWSCLVALVFAGIHDLARPQVNFLISSPSSMSLAACGHSRMGRPILMALRKKMRANEAAITHWAPDPRMATGACSATSRSRSSDRQPLTSPGFTWAAYSGLISQKTCWASSSGSMVIL